MEKTTIEQMNRAFQETAFSGERFVLKNKEKEPVVAIVPIEDLQILEAMEV